MIVSYFISSDQSQRGSANNKKLKDTGNDVLPPPPKKLKETPNARWALRRACSRSHEAS
uniref:Uncharacterized protein n=1 Tax=Fagus sylvatica TaxID=28930 RepID=A0A2N9FEM0_FAGSY